MIPLYLYTCATLPFSPLDLSTVFIFAPVHLHAYHKEETKVKALEAKVSRLLKEKAAREQELEEERRRGGKVEQELQELRGREAGEELQMAEVLPFLCDLMPAFPSCICVSTEIKFLPLPCLLQVKMAMHKEMLVKDEEITSLRGSLASVQGEREALAKEVRSPYDGIEQN